MTFKRNLPARWKNENRISTSIMPKLYSIWRSIICHWWIWFILGILKAKSASKPRFLMKIKPSKLKWGVFQLWYTWVFVYNHPIWFVVYRVGRKQIHYYSCSIHDVISTSDIAVNKNFFSYTFFKNLLGRFPFMDRTTDFPFNFKHFHFTSWKYSVRTLRKNLMNVIFAAALPLSTSSQNRLTKTNIRQVCANIPCELWITPYDHVRRNAVNE